MTKQHYPQIPLLRQFQFLKTAIIMLFLITSMLAQGQLKVSTATAASPAELLVENFDYPVGALLKDNGWTSHSGIGNFITVQASSISYPSYVGSGVGKEVLVSANIGSSDDVNKGFTAQTTGGVYCALLLNVTSTNTTGEYFAHFGTASGASIGSLYGRIFVKKDASTSNFAFGISKGTSAIGANFTGFTYTPGTTYLVVVKYSLIPGDTNDKIDLFINPVIGSVEPIPTISALPAENALADATQISSICLRQSTITPTSVIVDGLRVATTWAEAVKVPEAAATAPTVTTQAVSAIAATTATGNGDITVLGTPNVTAYGVCWNTPSGFFSFPPTILDSKVDNGTIAVTGSFTASMTGLVPETTYQVRAYATNSVGTSYGALVTFTTTKGPAVLITQSITAKTHATATGSGYFTSLGIANPTAHGVCWNTAGTPTINDNKSDKGAATVLGRFTAPITGLSPETTYHVRAYATNTNGTSYGNELTFTTTKPSVWTSRASASDETWESVTYGNGKFVAVSGYGVMTSPDGINWTLRTPAVTQQFSSVAFGNGLFVAISFTGISEHILTSPDGIAWTARGPVGGKELLSVTYGNGLFVIVGGSGNVTSEVLTSPDGINWTSRTATANHSWSAVTYGNGLFVAVSSWGTNDLMTSPDGINWTSRTTSVNNCWNTVTYGNGVFVALSGTGTTKRSMTSTDGINWTISSSTEKNYWKSITYANNLFVAVANGGGGMDIGDQVMTSPDGITWTLSSSATDNQWTSVASGNGLFVAVANSGTGDRVMTWNPSSTPAATAPTVTTQAVTAITQITATGNGNITALGTSNPTAYGVCWNTAGSPTTADSKTDKGAISATGAFTADMIGLTANTTYKVRAFATNSVNTVYGAEVTFTTLAAQLFNVSPTVLSGFTYIEGAGPSAEQYFNVSASNMTQNLVVTTSANYEISTNTGTAFTPTSPLYILKGNGTIGDTKIYVRLKANLAVGDYNNALISVTTTDWNPLVAKVKSLLQVDEIKTVSCSGNVTSASVTTAPTVTTQAVTAITQTTATGNGNITALGTSNPTAYGVCWNTAGSPTTTDSKTDKGAISATGAFTADMIGLIANTTYKVRAFATNSVNTVYGEEVTFKTEAAPAPIGTANIIKFNESDGLQPLESTIMKYLYFTIPSCSNYDLSELGVNIDATSSAGKIKMAIYNTTTKTLLYQTAEMSVTGGVSEYVSAAVPQGSIALVTGQYVVGIIGNPISGSIKINAASTFVNTGVATNVSTATLSQSTGINYPTFPEPFLNNVAYYRAMSVVVKGIDKSPTAPTVTTTAISAITKNSATSGGNITSDGGAAVTARGVCWNTTGSPTIASNKTNVGTGTGVFNGNLTGLAASTKYYVRAYATNCSTSYGEELSFTTATAVVAPSALSYSPNPVVAVIGTTNVNSTPTVTGSVDSYSISPALPTGITLNTTSGVISGMPSVLASLTVYSITATNVTGNTTATFTLTVNPKAPTALSYSPNPVVAVIGTTAVSSTPTVTGSVDSYSISPALPTGVTLNTTSGVISGTPSVISSLTAYSITATNVTGSINATFTLTVDPLPVLGISTGSIGLVIGSGPIVIDPALSISGVPRTNVYPGASVYFNPGFIASEDKLLYPVILNGVTGTYQATRGTTPQGVSVAYNAASGVLTLTGNATVAQYEAIFRTIQYQNTNPLTAVSTRSVTFQLGVAKGVRTIQLVLSVPTANAAQAVCGSGTVADLAATAPVGSSVRWYTVATGGAVLVSTTALVNGKYYAESWDGTSASPTRTEVTLTINVIPTKPLIAGQSSATIKVKLCPNDYIACSNFDNALSYQWKLNGSDIVGQTGIKYKVPASGAGNYALYVKNPTTGCENISATVAVTLYSVTIPVIYEKKKSDNISILIVDNTLNLYASYLWTYSNGTALPTGIVNNRQFLVLPPSDMNATYTVNIIDQNACSVSSNVKTVSLKAIEAKVYPTLIRDNFNVRLDGEKQEGTLFVKIFSQTGSQLRIYSFEHVQSEVAYQINSGDLKPGTYTVEITLGDYKQTQNVIVK